MPKPTSPFQAPAASADAFGAAVGGLLKSMSGLSLPPQEFGKLQSDYLKSVTDIWNQTLMATAPGAPGPLSDRRFAGQEWLQNPAAAYTAQMYLLNARTMLQMAESVHGDEKTKARIRFAVQQWADAAAPSNFLAFNPEALKKAVDTKGESIAAGLQHLLEDLQKGHVSQTDESAFEVGRNVATTAGDIVFENELFQLIEY